MTAPLPAWAQNETARDLIAQIQRDPPTYRITPGLWIEGGGARRYEGEAAIKLRRLWNAAGERLFKVAEAEYARGVPWNVAAADANACLGMSADKLIEQMVGERLTEVEELGPGRIAA